MKGNVLIISRYFPPGGGIGAFRAAKFVKYLPSFGWKPYVVSLPPERQEQMLADDISKTQYESIAEIPEEQIYIDVLFPRVSTSFGDMRRLPKLAYQLPEIVREYNIDIIFHTAPPFYSLPSVSWLSRKSDTPYIIDLRDPWYIDRQIFDGTKSVSNPAWAKINKHLERHTFSNANNITLSTNEMASRYIDKYPNLEERFITIPNGYDPSDYEISDHTPNPPDNFQIVYPGKFRNNMGSFVEVFSDISKDTSVELVHFGNKNRTHTEKFYNQMETAGVAHAIRKKGYTEFKSVVMGIKEADIGLVVTRQGDTTHVPQKTFDYIACDIPILALGPEHGELDAVLRPFENAYRVSHDNQKRMKDILEKLIRTAPDTLGAEEERQKHTRKYMTEKLSNVFKKAI